MEMKKACLPIRLVIVCLMAGLLLVSCSAPTSTPTQGPGTTPTPVPTAEPADPFGKYEPAITITSVRDIPNPAVVKYPEGQDVENNVWITTIREELGIEVKYDWVVDASQLSTRINAMITSGDFPDFFMCSSAQFNELGSAGLLADLTGAYDAYASDAFKSAMDDAGQAVIASATRDGALMGLPIIASKEFGPMLWVRTDWLEALDLEEPETIEDVIAIAKAFATQDPDGNQVNDTFGIPVNGNTSGGLMWALGFMNSLGSYPMIWTENDHGDLVYGSITENTKNALGRLRELYDAGAIDPEFITKDYWATYDPLTSGKYGIVYGPYYISISPLQPIVNNNDKAQFKPFPLLGPDGNAKTQQASPTSGYYVVRKDCAHPEAVIKLMNFWYREFYFSPDQARYEKMINGPEFTSIYSSTPIMSYMPWANLDNILEAKRCFDGEITEDQIPPIGRQSYQDVLKYKNGDIAAWMWERVYTALTTVMTVNRDGDLIQPDRNLAPPGEAMSLKWGTLSAMEMEAFSRIISGESPIEAFDTFVTEWKAAGGDEVTAEINTWFDTQQP